MFRLNTLRYLFVLIFQSANAENMRDVTKMESANARKAISRNKRNAYWLKVCVSLITVELLQTATSLRTATFFADGTTATSLQQSLSSIPKAVKEGFNCNCNITSENTVRLLYSLFCCLKRLHFTSFSHPSHKNHQGSFHLSPSLVNRKYYIFLAPSKIKGDAYSTKSSGHVILLTSVLLGGLALTAWIWRLPLLSLLMFCELRWNSFHLSVDLFLTFPICITHIYTA